MLIALKFYLVIFIVFRSSSQIEAKLFKPKFSSMWQTAFKQKCQWGSNLSITDKYKFYLTNASINLSTGR